MMSSCVERALNIAFTAAAIAAVVLAVIWPVSLCSILDSRLSLVLLALAFIVCGFFAYPKIGSGFTLGIREFLKESRELISGDDDDDPKTA